MTTVSAQEIEVQAIVYLNTYSQDELWKLLIYEWKQAELNVVPVRGVRNDLEKFLKGIVDEIKQRIRINQGVAPIIVTTVAGEVISYVSVSHPELMQFKIPIALLVGVVAQAVQAQFLKDPPNPPTTSP